MSDCRNKRGQFSRCRVGGRARGRRARATRKLIGNIGDVNALNYGGGLILQSGGDYQIVRFEGWEDRGAYSPDEFSVYGDPKPGAKMAVSIVNFAPGEKYWVEDYDLESVGSTYGMPVSELRGMLRSNDPRVMAGGIEAIAGNYGWDELDHSPQEMTRTEINKDWGRWLR